MPYDSYLDLVQQCEDDPIFDKWWSCNVYNKKQPTLIKLLVLCVLCYLGRGWRIDDLVEAMTINQETIRQFIHKFIYFGSTSLYDKYVRIPTNKEELDDCAAEFKQAGFAGAIGSTDATHIVIEKCSYRLRQIHMGYKMKHRGRTYNITVNHRRRILSSTSGHPARFNDKTLVIFDEFCKKLKNGGYMMNRINLEKYKLIDINIHTNTTINIKNN